MTLPVPDFIGYLLLAALLGAAAMFIGVVGAGLRNSNRRRDEAVERFGKRYAAQESERT